MKKLIFFICSVNSIFSADIKEITKEAFIFGYPLVTLAITRDQFASKNGINKFFHMKEFPSETSYVPRLNPDTLYSSAFLDLSKSPIILSVPDTNGRYYLLQVMDAWTNVITSIGSRTTGTKENKFLIVGPNWNGPINKEFKNVIKSPTNTVWILARIQTTKKDYAIVHKLQEQMTLTPLNKKYSEEKYIPNPATNLKEPATGQIGKMSANQFFDRLAQELIKDRPAKADGPEIEKFKKIGFIIGQDFHSPVSNKELTAGIKEGLKEIKKQALNLGKRVNGWNFDLETGSFGTHYLDRASTAYAGIGANLPADAIYPTAYIDGNGKFLNGKNKYIIKFDKNSIPPVNAFWSLALYDSRGYLVSNPINRFALGSSSPLSYNADGSLDIYIQNEKPNDISNWLPAPKGKFNLQLRLYWPKEQVLNGNWNPPPVKVNTSDL